MSKARSSCKILKFRTIKILRSKIQIKILYRCVCSRLFIPFRQIKMSLQKLTQLLTGIVIVVEKTNLGKTT